jgi:peroxiredoxin
LFVIPEGNLRLQALHHEENCHKERMMKLVQTLLWKRWIFAAACGATLAGACVMARSVRAQAAQTTTTQVITVPVKGLPDTLTPADQRKAAPDFTLNDTQGHSVSLSGYKGKVVLLDFWATWCAACQFEVPWYSEFSKKYAEKGLAVVGVSMDKDGLTSVKPYMEQKKMDYTVVLGNDYLVPQFGLKTIPVTWLIDREGRVAVAHVGMADKESFEANIQKLLQEVAPQ